MKKEKEAGEMDVKSYLKSASLATLIEVQEFLGEEIKSRQAKPNRGDHVITYTDGAARGNPGPAGVGVLLFSDDDQKVMQDYRYIGECTNNEAEYKALLLALDHASEYTQKKVQCFMDSELLVRQLNGQYAVKAEHLQRFYNDVKKRMARFKEISFTHVPREHPKLRLADALANKAIDEAKSQIRSTKI